MPQIETEYETTEGLILLVTADITPGMPATQPDLNGPGDPAEDATIEIIKVEVKDWTFVECELEGACWTQFEGEQW